jgi:hypothetical protein
MSRIDQNHAAQATAAAHHAAQQAQQRRKLARHAALYRGTTLFAHGSDTTHVALEHSLKAKKMLARLARQHAAMLFNALKTTTPARPHTGRLAAQHGTHLSHARVNAHDGHHGNQGNHRDDSGGDDEGQHGNDPQGGNQGNGRQGSGGQPQQHGQGRQGGQQRDQQQREPEADHAEARVKSTTGAAGTRGVAASTQTDATAGPSSVTAQPAQDAWLNTLIALRDAVWANPRMKVSQLVWKASKDLLSSGIVPPDAYHAFLSHANSQPRRQAAHTAQPDETPRANRGLQPGQSTLALLPLLAKQGSTPRTTTQRQIAEAIMDSQIAGAQTDRHPSIPDAQRFGAVG